MKHGVVTGASAVTAAPANIGGKQHGEVRPKEPEPIEAPVLPIVLKGSLTLNLPHEEAVERYGLWKVKILRRCSVHGTILDPGDSADLTGDVVQMLVMRRDAVVEDKRMREEGRGYQQSCGTGYATENS